MNFSGLNAFPLTPLVDDQVDKDAFATLVQRLVDADVDAVTVLGSTGSYAYLSGAERADVARLAVEHAGSTPVCVGIGALRTSDVLDNAEEAQVAGAAGLLLAPMSYQPLTEEEVCTLFRTVTAHSSVPVIVYDNPSTTHFRFSTALHARIAALPGITSVKIPGVPGDAAATSARVTELRAAIPDHVGLGISGDAAAAVGLSAGCETWYSVVGGILPAPALRITAAALAGDTQAAQAESARLEPLWEMFGRYGGSLRVVAAIAEHLGLARRSSLPRPLLSLDDGQRAHLAEVIERLGLDQ